MKSENQILKMKNCEPQHQVASCPHVQLSWAVDPRFLILVSASSKPRTADLNPTKIGQVDRMVPVLLNIAKD